MCVQIDINDERILQTAKVFKLVEIVEEFPLNGEERSFRRRDLRRGRLYAQTQITQSGYKTRCAIYASQTNNILIAE